MEKAYMIDNSITSKTSVMQTILGANGIIGEELAKALHQNYTTDIRLVGRNPEKVLPDNQLVKADLFNPESTKKALENTEIAFLTVGLPYKSDIWLQGWVNILDNVIEACKTQGCKLVYFDNTYAYPQDTPIQKEDTPLVGQGKKGQGKKQAADRLLKSIKNREVEAVICRAPEFYGPGKTKGVTNTLIFENLKKGKSPKVLLNDKVKRTLIYTPDASRATAMIGNTPDAYGQTWHLPCDDNRLTYKQFIGEISHQLNRKINYSVLSPFILKILSFFNGNIKEILELLPRYAIDNIFDSSKFQKRFPEFEITSYQKGIEAILKDYKIH